MYYLCLLMIEVVWIKDELKEVLDDVIFFCFKVFIFQFLLWLYIEVFFYGNIIKQVVLGIMQMVEDIFIEYVYIKFFFLSQLVWYREVQFFDRGWFVYQQRNEVYNNCGIEIYY